ncbi:DHA2 family efflux MFS transporter permease subunit [Sporolactobacillus shoreicorticis]|uniref:MDR family MFS transporter n=1 Tax=Sporolactobacillus shoreicorticis TaxID=1923877 RepID=A0ABW5S2K8_9BACL|nr:MDR family MFS transporter [Sporolactobacillus shoreicorticis]MCO7127114.1 DHA2 family efflux MFS transporter permease subunit [Sporolactobacillus shoreicorticis]
MTTLAKTKQEIKRGPITVALIIGAFVAILNETLLNIALSDLIGYFHVTATTVQWLTTAYLLVIGVLMPVTALLTGWFTTRQMFLGAMTIFLIGTVICGFAPTFSFLLVGRVIQAAGSGLILPVMMNTILFIYPPDKRGGAMGLIGLVIMFAPALGPTLSGLIIASLSWRWLFYLVLPLAVFSILFAARYLTDVSQVTKPKVDVVSVILSTLGFGGLVYGMGSGAEGGWLSIVLLVVGVASLILFVWRQLAITNPILDFRAFKYPMYTLATIILILVMVTLFATMILLPLYLQQALLLSSFSAGLVLLPGGLINGMLSPVMGKLFDKFGPRWLVTPGLLIMCIVIWLFSRLTVSESMLYVIILYAALLIGMSMVMMPVTTTGMNQLPKQMYPHGTAIMNTLQQVAGGIGTALFIGIMVSGQQAYLSRSANPEAPAQMLQGLVAGMSRAFFIALVVGVISLLLSLFLKRTVAPKEDHAEG